MPAAEIEEFGRILITYVRDAAIRSSDRELDSTAGSPVAKRWREASLLNAEEFARVVFPDVIDDALFYLLQAIDQGLLKISFSASNGEKVDLFEAGAGELSGWYMGSEGWRRMYSKERFADDFYDLR